MTTPEVIPDELPADIAASAPTGRGRRIFRLSTLPAAVTVGNLVCGVLAIAYLGDAQAYTAAGETQLAAGRVVLAGWLILLGMAFDGFDGRIARITRTTTQFGGALDSLADVVTFGVAPAIAGKVLMEGALGFSHPRMTFLTAAFYAVCACLRLARYNAEHEESSSAPVTHFGGLPTPGAAGVIAGLAMIHSEVLAWWEPSEAAKIATAYLLGFGALAGLGLLMVSRVPYVHFANSLRGRRTVGRVALLFFVMMLVANFDLALVLAMGFLGYALSGPVMVLPRLLRPRSGGVTELFD